MAVHALSPSSQRRFWILGVILAGVVLLVVVFGIVMWIRIDRIQLLLEKNIDVNADDGVSFVHIAFRLVQPPCSDI
jgi:hypothetical protein